MKKARVGLFCIGLNTYWEQFDGLKCLVEENYNKIYERMPDSVDCVSAGLVDSFEKAQNAGRLFGEQQVDLVFCYSATYSPSSNVLPVFQKLDVPVIVLNLQPRQSENFGQLKEIGQWLGTLSCAAAPEVTAVLLKKGLKFSVVTGSIQDEQVTDEIEQWCRVANVRANLNDCKLGLIGHAYPGMMDLYVDETKIYNEMGVFTEFVELHQIKNELETVSEEAITYFKNMILERFELDVDENAPEFVNLCRSCAAVWKFTQEKRLDAIAMHYAGETEGEYQPIVGPMNIIFSLLMAMDIPCCVEGDIKTTIAMLILKVISQCCATAELYGMDLDDDICLIGHSGSSDFALSDKKPVLKESEVFHGKSGKGYLTQFFVKEGEVTLLALSEDDKGNYRMITAVGRSEDGDILMLGDTNTRVRFSMPIREFINKWCNAGPSHHFALTVGNYVDLIKKTGYMCGLDVIEIA